MEDVGVIAVEAECIAKEVLEAVKKNFHCNLLIRLRNGRRRNYIN